MGMGVSIFLFAVGAILALAVQTSVQGLDIQTVGVILMLVGGFGFFASMFLWGPWSSGERSVRSTRGTDGITEVVTERHSTI